MAENLDESIRENAAGPSKVSGDAGTVEQHPLTDQIAVDRYLQSKQAARSKKLGLRLTKIVPPGSN